MAVTEGTLTFRTVVGKVKGEKGDKGDKGDPGVASQTIRDTITDENHTWSSKKITEETNKDYATLSSKTNVSSATLTDSADGNIASITMYGKAEKVGDTLIMSKGEVESQSANLVQMESGGINQTTGEPSTSSSTIRSANFVDYTSTSTFVISGVTPTQTTSAIRIFEYSTNGAYVQSRLVYIGTDNTAKLTFSGDGKFKLHISTEIASVNTLMLNSGNVAKSYVPYGHSEISAYDVVQNYLLSVSDVKDELCVNADGSGVLNKNTKILEITSFSGVTNNSDGSVRAYVDISETGRTENLIACLAEGFDYISTLTYDTRSSLKNGEMFACKSGSNLASFFFGYPSGSTLDALNAQLATKPIKVIYVAEKTTPTNLTASQVQSLLALETYKSHTDIVADCTVDVTYYKDNANGQSVADIDARYRKLFDSIIDSLS